MPDLETVERLIRRGIYTGPLNLTWVGIGGGFDGPNPYNMMEFIRRTPDGACLTLETVMRNVLPVNTMAIAMGLHPRCGNEDTLWGKPGEKITSVQQIEQLVRISDELGRRSPPARKRAKSTRSALVQGHGRDARRTRDAAQPQEGADVRSPSSVPA